MTEMASTRQTVVDSVFIVSDPSDYGRMKERCDMVFTHSPLVSGALSH